MSLLRYLLWRTAAVRFGRRPWELDGEAQAEIAAQTARERHVIVRALAAPEAVGVEADPDVVGAAVAALAEGYQDRNTFLADLARGGLDEDGLVEAIALELRAGLVLDRIGATFVDESAVHSYYMRHAEKLVVPERRAARHILITINSEFAENSRERAEARLGEIADLLAAGTEFATLALRHSECPSSLDGGRLGEFHRGQLYPELESALFSMSPGEVRRVETSLGLHLLRCDAVIPPQPISYEAATPGIRRKLESRSRDRALRAWLKGEKESEGNDLTTESEAPDTASSPGNP